MLISFPVPILIVSPTAFLFTLNSVIALIVSKT